MAPTVRARRCFVTYRQVVAYLLTCGILSASIGGMDTLTIEQFWLKVKRGDGCWEWQGTRFPEGYGVFSRMGAHRIAWILTNGAIRDGLCVLHRCDNPPCVNPAHLFLGTKQDNKRDCMEKGRARLPDNRGERCANAKLSTSDIIEIRRLYRETQIKHRELALRYHIHQSHVSRIITGVRWAHIPDS